MPTKEIVKNSNQCSLNGIIVKFIPKNPVTKVKGRNMNETNVNFLTVSFVFCDTKEKYASNRFPSKSLSSSIDS
jgi:L-cystine uptake protein TcyP (sodium:dicarboxylate symporter family)